MMGFCWLSLASHYYSTPNISLVYDRFPRSGASSKVSIVHIEQVIHVKPSDAHIITLNLFSRSVDILSHDLPHRCVAVVRVPQRFWFYVLAGRAKPELLVIRGPIDPVKS
jgi:hypothetical protein